MNDRYYYWLLVNTERGEVDVVANPDQIEGDISSGHSVQAIVSMVGRIIERVDTP